MKKRNLIIGFFFPIFCYAQVGVKTDTPQRTLHVNGSLQVTNEINLGGTTNTAGSAGQSNQVLVSQGPGNPATWKNANDLVSTPNSYSLKSFDPLSTTERTLTTADAATGLSYSLGTKSGLTISKPDNIVVLYIDIDTYSYQLFNQSAIAYSFLTNISVGSTEIQSLNSGNLILEGSVFTDSRGGNFRSFVYKNLPVGNINVGVYAKRLNSQGPNGSKDLKFLAGNVHIYVYEKN